MTVDKSVSSSPLAPAPPPDETAVRRWLVRGLVLGVGFRPFVYRLAREFGLRGFVRNDAAGLIIEGWGTADQLERFERRFLGEGPVSARIEGVELREAVTTRTPPEDFRVQTRARRGRASMRDDVWPDETPARRWRDVDAPARVRTPTGVEDLLRQASVTPEGIAGNARREGLAPAGALHRVVHPAPTPWSMSRGHAYLAALLAEHARTERIVAIVCDGREDGAERADAGGEILVGDLHEARCAARFRPLRTPRAWRSFGAARSVAASWVLDGMGAAPLRDRVGLVLFPDRSEREAFLEFVDATPDAPGACTTGMLFAAASVLIDGRLGAEEGETIGARMDAAARRAGVRLCGRHQLPLLEPKDPAAPLELDHRALVGRLADQRVGAADPAVSSWLFLDALADALARAAVRAAEEIGVDTIGVTGSLGACPLFTERIGEQLDAFGYEVLRYGRGSEGVHDRGLAEAAVAASSSAGEARMDAPARAHCSSPAS